VAGFSDLPLEEFTLQNWAVQGKSIEFIRDTKDWRLMQVALILGGRTGTPVLVLG